MKLPGISAGRKLRNSEILLKEALMASEQTGDRIPWRIIYESK